MDEVHDITARNAVCDEAIHNKVNSLKTLDCFVVKTLLAMTRGWSLDCFVHHVSLTCKLSQYILPAFENASLLKKSIISREV